MNCTNLQQFIKIKHTQGKENQTMSEDHNECRLLFISAWVAFFFFSGYFSFISKKKKRRKKTTKDKSIGTEHGNNYVPKQLWSSPTLLTQMASFTKEQPVIKI